MRIVSLYLQTDCDMSRLIEINRLQLAELDRFNWDKTVRGGVRALYSLMVNRGSFYVVTPNGAPTRLAAGRLLTTP